MENKQYGSALANAYDILNDGIDYQMWADFIEQCIKKFSNIPVSEICETACGTGSMACELARRGYSVTASDISEEMLTAADAKARSNDLSVRFVLQDMRHLKMFSEKDIILCMLDSMNYLTRREDMKSAFLSAHSCLKTGGIFIFDLNSKYKFENIYSDNSYILESGDIYCGWENNYNSKTGICDFYLSIFSRCADGKYIRSDEFQREKMYTIRQMTRIINESGFSLCGIFGSFDFIPADENHDERLYFIVKK